MDQGTVVKIALEALVLIVGIALGWGAMRAELAGTREQVLALLKASSEHNRAQAEREENYNSRLIRLEADRDHHGQRLEEGLRRIETEMRAQSQQIRSLHQRFDRLLTSGRLRPSDLEVEAQEG